MEVYKMVRFNRDSKTETPICRFKAADYDDAIRIGERIEVFPGIFGDDTVGPNADAVLIYRDRS